MNAYMHPYTDVFAFANTPSVEPRLEERVAALEYESINRMKLSLLRFFGFDVSMYF